MSLSDKWKELPNYSHWSSTLTSRYKLVITIILRIGYQYNLCVFLIEHILEHILPGQFFDCDFLFEVLKNDNVRKKTVSRNRTHLVNLQGLVLKDIRLFDIRLKRIDFSHSKFTRVSFRKIWFTRSFMKKCTFSRCQFFGCDFNTCAMIESVIDNCQIDGARGVINISNSTLENSIFYGSQISGSIFYQSKINNTIFERCNMDLVNFNRNVLENINFIDVYDFIYSNENNPGSNNVKVKNTIRYNWGLLLLDI